MNHKPNCSSFLLGSINNEIPTATFNECDCVPKEGKGCCKECFVPSMRGVQTFCSNKRCECHSQAEGKCEHDWHGQRAGGSPMSAESYEWVCFCKLCGEEYDEERHGKITTEPAKEWSREFDDLFESHWRVDEQPKGSVREIKAFISKELSKAREEVVRDILNLGYTQYVAQENPLILHPASLAIERIENYAKSKGIIL